MDGGVARSSALPMLLPVIAGNALVAWLLATGRMHVVEVLLLTTLECLALHVAVALGERIGKGRGRRRRRKREGLFVAAASVLASTLALAALLAMMWAAQYLQLLLFGVEDAGFGRLREPLDLLLHSPLLWPLAITVGVAAWNLRAGRVAEEERQIAARLLTLVLGAFPFIAPALLLGGAAARSWLRARKDAPGAGRDRALPMAVAALVLMMATVPSLPVLAALGVAGWMISFLGTKLLLEATLALTPLRTPSRAARPPATVGTGDTRRPGEPQGPIC